MLSDTSLTFALGLLATVMPPAPVKTSKNDLLEPRLNLSVAPALIITGNGFASVPGSIPFEPARPSTSVPA